MCKKIVLFLMMVLCFAVTMSAAKQNFTLVIDAGHGGNDAGAVGAISKEKNLTLKFALAFGKLVEQNCPDVKVVYTRKTDRFVELYRRAEIANNNKADLFISIHINALPKGHQARGFQTYTLGKSRRTGKKNGVMENLEVAKRENSVIYLEKDYQQTYHGFDPNSPESEILFEFVQDKNMENSIELAKFMQRYVCQATGRQDMGAHQDNLAVLRLTSMPGCLIELGFISSRDEEQFMNSAGAADKYARGIYNAFVAYRKRFSGGNASLIPESKVQAPKVQEQAPVVKEEIPVVREEPPAVREEAPVVREEAPVVKEEAPKSQEQTPKVVETPKAVPSDAPVFKVQILVSSTQLKQTDARLKGLTGTDFYRENGMYKYTTGASTNYNEIYQLRKRILNKFPEAFIIAFKNGVRTDVQEAIREFKNRKK
jgi:N-acetylmuramoyl-L-alanine amidase